MSTSTATPAVPEVLVRPEDSRPEPVAVWSCEMLPMLRHELRSPLAGVVGLADVMLRALDDSPHPDPEAQRHQLELVKASGRRMLALLDELVRAVEIEAGDTVQVMRQERDCRPIITQAVDALRPVMREKGLVLQLQLPGEPLLADLDATMLGEVLHRILHNAVTFTDSGSILVRAQAPTEATGGRIDVVDTGPGIADEDRERIFAPFERGRTTGGANEEGSGLGLYLARAAATHCAATIAVSGDPRGPGVTFTVHLPGGRAGAASVLSTAAEGE